MALVEIKHLKKYYNTPRGLLHAIDDVTMDIEKGKTIGIVGESGCGKSTLDPNGGCDGRRSLFRWKRSYAYVSA